MTTTIEHETEEELDRKLAVIMEARGFKVEKLVKTVTVQELAVRFGRLSHSISRSLRRFGLDRIEHRKDKRGIKELIPTNDLMIYLATWQKPHDC